MHNKEYRIFKKVLLHIALLIVVLISIFPFIWMLTVELCISENLWAKIGLTSSQVLMYFWYF